MKEAKKESEVREQMDLDPFIFDGEGYRSSIRAMKDQVEYILKKDTDARNIDMRLLVMVAEYFYQGDMTAFNHETATRIRRAFQEQNYYMPTDPKVLQKRRRLPDIMKEERRNIGTEIRTRSKENGPEGRDGP